MDRERLITLFRYWGDVEAKANLSDLYAVLGHTVAASDFLLDLAAQALPGQPPPNVLFAAAHALLPHYPGHPLAGYYATVGGSKAADPDAGRWFKEFCGEHRTELLSLVQTRLTQTNEVRRSAVLLPIFASIAEDTGRPLSLIEVGPSAGLNLNLDRYQYRYGDLVVGDSSSPVILDCDARGTLTNVAVPRVASRVGIDINPLDVSDEGDVAWLRALLWPEHLDRRALLDAAIEVARLFPPRLLRGDVLELLPGEVAGAPQDSEVTIFATFVLNQFPLASLTRLKSLLLELSSIRPIHVVVMGFSEFVVAGHPRAGDTGVWTIRLENGRGEYRCSSLANPHGRWIEVAGETPWQPWNPPLG